jgi:xylan 1,4-beta-xylosidase
VTWAFEFEDQPEFAALRALATDGIDKPVLNAFRLMGKLSGDWIETEGDGALPLEDVVTHSVTDASDVDAVATRNGKEIDVLVWNYHDADVAASDAQVQVEVDGLRGARAEASEFRMDATHSNAYRVWLRMGSPAKPSSEQLEELQKAGQLEQARADHSIAANHGRAKIALSVPRQGIVLVRLREK